MSSSNPEKNLVLVRFLLSHYTLRPVAPSRAPEGSRRAVSGAFPGNLKRPPRAFRNRITLRSMSPRIQDALPSCG